MRMKNIFLAALVACSSFSVDAANYRREGDWQREVITTVGANNFTCPANTIHAILIGGGGEGGGGLNDANFGGGGGGGPGQLLEFDYNCSPGETLTVTIGAGGTGAGAGGTSGNQTAGNNGGSTTLAGSSIELGTYTALGGAGGGAGAAAGGTGGGLASGGTCTSTPAGGAAAAALCATATNDYGPTGQGVMMTGSGGGATGGDPGNSINMKNVSEGIRTTTATGGGGTGGYNKYFVDPTNQVGGNSGGNAPTVTATCYGCGGGGGSGANGSAGNGADGIQGVAIITWQ